MRESGGPWNQLFVLQEIDAQLDQLREQEQMAALLVDRRLAHLEAARVTAGQRSGEIVAALAQRQEERVALLRQFPAELVALYKGARRRWPMRPWVVVLSGSSCSACRLDLLSRLGEGAPGLAEPVLCPGCGRLLVSDGRGAEVER
jgi:predicted  nucleic acid-binding Zn-ribbon protein